MLEKIRSFMSKWSGRPKADPEPEPAARALDPEHPPPDTPSGENKGTADGRENWKQKALSDFKSWLLDLPDTIPDAAGANDNDNMDACDLYTLLSEFSALRQEIRMQNREQHRTIGTLETLAGDIRNTAREFDETRGDHRRAVETVDLLARELRASADHLRRHVEKEIKREAEKRTVMPFLDIRDALVRGRQAARDAGRARGLFRKPPKEMESVIEGYDMALRRFDRALAAVGIHPVNANGRLFDPAVMRAVETCSRPDMEKGHVAAEPLSGFVRGDEVIRTAEVVVNQ